MCVCVQEEFIEEILIEYVNVDDEDFFCKLIFPLSSLRVYI